MDSDDFRALLISTGNSLVLSPFSISVSPEVLLLLAVKNVSLLSGIINYLCFTLSSVKENVII